MAVKLFSNLNPAYDGGLYTANGALTLENYNLGAGSATLLALTAAHPATPQITFTPATNHSCQGAIVGFGSNTGSVQDRGIVVKLRSYNGSVWSDVAGATQTLNQAQIYGNTTMFTPLGVVLAFTWTATALTAGTQYGFSIATVGGANGSWSITTSNGTAPTYAEITTVQGTFADNDAIICHSKVTIRPAFYYTLNGAHTNAVTTITVNESTASAPAAGSITVDSETISYTGKGTYTFTGCTRGAHNTLALAHSNGANVSCSPIIKGVTSTGSTIGTAVLLCRAADTTAGHTGQLILADGSYNYECIVVGMIYASSYSALSLGTSGTPLAKRTSLYFDDPALSSLAVNCGYGFFASGISSGTYYEYFKMSFFAFGTTDPNRWTTLAAPAAAAATTIQTTNDMTGKWAVDDRFVMTDVAVNGFGDSTVFRIANISGTTLTFTPAIPANKQRAQGAYVVRYMGNYGSIVSNLTNRMYLVCGNCRELIVKSINMYGLTNGGSGFSFQSSGDSVSLFDSQNCRSRFTLDRCNFFADATVFGGPQNVFSTTPLDGFDITNNFGFGHYVFIQCCMSPGYSGTLVIDSNIMNSTYNGPWFTLGSIYTLTNNKFSNFAYGDISTFHGTSCTITGNTFYCCGYPGVVQNSFGTLVALASWKNNSFINTAAPMGQSYLQGSVITGFTMDSDTYNGFASVWMISGAGRALVNFDMLNPTGDLFFNPIAKAQWAAGSKIRISKYNTVLGANVSEYPNGRFFSWSTTKTTQRTESKTLPHAATWLVGSGPGIAGFPIQVRLTSKTLNAGYYAGTYVSPTASITYDGATTVSAANAGVAGALTQLALGPFTPTQDNAVLSLALSTQTDRAYPSASATMTIADPCVVTDMNHMGAAAAHPFSNGDPVEFHTSGALPTIQLYDGTAWAWTNILYVRSTGANTYNLYDTAAHAIAGGTTGRIKTSGTQANYHWRYVPMSDVEWDSCVAVVRRYGYVHQQTSIPLNACSDAVVASIPAPAVNGFITMSSAAAGALTGIAYDGTTITLTTAHTAWELYHYFQWWAAQSANLGSANPFDTLDGATFTCAANLTINGVALTATGQTINVGVNSLSQINGGTSDGIIKGNSFTQVPLLISNLVAGANVYLKTAGGTQLILATASGTTQNATFAYSADTSVSLVVRQYGYQDYLASGVIRSTGLTIVVAQIPNAFLTLTYAQAMALAGISFAGSTATETSSHTISEVYQRLQAESSSLANTVNAQLMTTTDQTTYSLNANFTLDGCVLSGNGNQKVVNLGSYTYTKLNGASTSGVTFIDGTGTHTQIILSGIVVGSTVGIYDLTAGTTLYGPVVMVATGLAFDYLYQGSTHQINIKVRNQDYLVWESTVPVAAAGLNLPVNQTYSPIYSQTGVDGSTVTEFFFSGSVIKAYLNDPLGTTTVQRFIAWYLHAIATTTYIGIQPADVSCPSAQWAVLLNGLQIKNVGTGPVEISGGNITDINNSSLTVIDTTGQPLFIVSSMPSADATAMASASATAVWSAVVRTLTSSEAPSADQIAAAVLKIDWATISGEARASVLNALRGLGTCNRVGIDMGVITVYKEDGSVAYLLDSLTDVAAQPIVDVRPQ